MFVCVSVLYISVILFRETMAVDKIKKWNGGEKERERKGERKMKTTIIIVIREKVVNVSIGNRI